MQNKPWHMLAIPQAFEKLESQNNGLSRGEVAERMAKYGPNELQAARRVSL